MSQIHLLPPRLIAQVAAGEVIERPAVVVKELLENAVDAGATQITIEITQGGLESILVADNGFGMDAEDLDLCWQRHTTSKLAVTDDLTRIATLGFRGEALASMAAVSELTIQSRLSGAIAGNMIAVKQGILHEKKPVGMAPGTIVRVENIFSGLPARRKFLHSAQTEWQHCIECIEAHTLAHPQVRFVVKHNKKLILNFPAQTREERLVQVLGTEVATNSFPFTLKSDTVVLEGFLGTPQISFQTRIPSYSIVNQRVVKNSAIIKALRESYRGLLQVDATPLYLLYLQVPPEMIDVNIHPRKEEVAFLNEADLCRALKEQVTATAHAQHLSYRWVTPKGDTESFAATTVRADVIAQLKKITPETPIIQLHNVYSVTETQHGLLLIDQHAAHERILYERFLDTYTQRYQEKRIHRYAKSQKLSLPLSQAVVLESNLETLTRLGFDLERVDQQSYKIHAVPELFQDRNLLQLFQELLYDLETQSELRSIDAHTNRMLSYLACRTAIKAGEPLAAATLHELVHDLAHTKLAYTCPHGRPTHIEVSLYELEKMFGRT